MFGRCEIMVSSKGGERGQNSFRLQLKVSSTEVRQPVGRGQLNPCILLVGQLIQNSNLETYFCFVPPPPEYVGIF